MTYLDCDLHVQRHIYRSLYSPRARNGRVDKKPKPFLKEIIECPHCGKKFGMKAYKRILTPSTPAETKIEIETDASQTRLDEEGD